MKIFSKQKYTSKIPIYYAFFFFFNKLPQMLKFNLRKVQFRFNLKNILFFKESETIIFVILILKIRIYNQNLN